MAKFKDDVITYIEEDVEKIQKKSGMYISYKGPKGALHLAKEVINNGIDEVVNKRSPGQNVAITFEESKNMITVSDDGRGIPFDKVELVCTKIQSGSKFVRDSDVKGVKNKGFYAGENGVGLTAVNALSDMLCFVICRDGQKGTFLFKKGHLVSKSIVKKDKKDPAHGTTVSFIPSEEFLGPCKVSLKDLKEWVTYISYLVPEAGMVFNYNTKGSDIFTSITLDHQNGIADLLADTMKKPLVPPIYINFKGSYRITDDDKVEYSNEDGEIEYENDIIIQAAFSMDNTVHTDEDSHYISFCDYINTVDHGVHVNAAKTAWCQVISKLTNDSLSDTEAKKFQASFEDARTGLFAVINIMCDNPLFASQTKEKVTNDELFKPIRKIIYDGLMRYLKENIAYTKKLTNFVKTNMKSRMEITKIHKSETKPIDSLSENTLKCFNPANGSGYKELFIVEGGSAKGTLVLARDARTQALFSLRGVPKNAFGLKLVEILANQEFKYLVRVLGCGIGKDFNIDRLKYNKIIIFTDSDIDGFRIASLLCTFFLTQYPEIIKRGILYKAVAPLYIIEDPKHPFILNKIEYYGYFADKLVKIMKLYDKDGNQYTNGRFKELIIRNNQYLSTLDALINYYSVNADIIEFVAEFKTPGISDAKFNKLLKSRFDEMVFDEGVVKGVYQGAYQYLTVDKIFDQRVAKLRELIFNNGENIVGFDDGKVAIKKATIGQLLRYSKKYMPVVKQRLKGLGEMNADNLWKSALNPATRELIQLTSRDIEEELQRFQILHGKDSDARKELMKEYVLNIDDIDN